MVKGFFAAIGLATVVVYLTLTLFAQDVKRSYHPYTIAQVTAENPLNWKHPLTHLSVDGWVTYKVREGDGDWHIRICDALNVTTMDAKRCVVAECIPRLPCIVPKIGDHINVQGIYRYDAENPGHHWHEIHPVEQLTEIK